MKSSNIFQQTANTIEATCFVVECPLNIARYATTVLTSPKYKIVKIPHRTSYRSNVFLKYTK